MIIPVKWTDEGVNMLDQRLLPTEETWLMLKTYNDVAAGITDMVVRGAPAIGVSAAYGVALGANGCFGLKAVCWLHIVRGVGRELLHKVITNFYACER